MHTRLRALFFTLTLTLTSTLLLAEADGKWLHRVPDEEHVRHSPYAGQPQAAEAGKVLFAENCVNVRTTRRHLSTSAVMPPATMNPVAGHITQRSTDA